MAKERLWQPDFIATLMTRLFKYLGLSYQWFWMKKVISVRVRFRLSLFMRICKLLKGPHLAQNNLKVFLNLKMRFVAYNLISINDFPNSRHYL
jgi:hypothetical protein